MSIPEIYLQTAWGDSIDDVDMEDIRDVIEETLEMDEENGRFWVGIFVGDNEVVLESRKNMTVLGIFNDSEEEEIEAQFDSWTEIESLYELFLAKDFAQVAAIMRKK
ncbi:hypothetical protein ACFP1I_03240 [Dyadobacter subterraneus]|uniref:Uncharacterized protein n=1 Tax=Dyadobacter subterraneus TaxID=2773304 RepID=A0ABR9W4L8_9BACT|nr:hypothetical protein [Dyadobacter subterraneus]MBE9460390.1 hypothetical protein [Dyadobacter subterraneus]